MEVLPTVDKENAPVDCNAVPPSTPGDVGSSRKGLNSIRQRLMRTPGGASGQGAGLERIRQRLESAKKGRPGVEDSSRGGREALGDAVGREKEQGNGSRQEEDSRKKKELEEISAAIKHLKRLGVHDQGLWKAAFDSRRSEDQAQAWKCVLEMILEGPKNSKADIGKAIDLAHEFLRPSERALRSNEDYIWIRVQRPLHRNRFQDGHETFQALVKHAKIGVRSPFFYQSWMSYAREHGHPEVISEIADMAERKGAVILQAAPLEPASVGSSVAGEPQPEGAEREDGSIDEGAQIDVDKEEDESECEEEEPSSSPQLLPKKSTPRYDRRSAITASMPSPLAASGSSRHVLPQQGASGGEQNVDAVGKSDSGIDTTPAGVSSGLAVISSQQSESGVERESAGEGNQAAKLGEVNRGRSSMLPPPSRGGLPPRRRGTRAATFEIPETHVEQQQQEGGSTATHYPLQPQTERFSRAEDPGETTQTQTGIVSLRSRGTRRLGFSAGAKRVNSCIVASKGDTEDTSDTEETVVTPGHVASRTQSREQHPEEEEEVEVQVQPRSAKRGGASGAEDGQQVAPVEGDEEPTQTQVVVSARKEEQRVEEEATVVSFGSRQVGGVSSQPAASLEVAETPRCLVPPSRRAQRGEVEEGRRALFKSRAQTRTPVRPAASSAAAMVPATPNAGVKYFEVNGVCYQKLSCIGKGGGGRVYKVMNPDHELFALKVIDLRKAAAVDSDAVDSVLNEVELLKRLRGKDDIIQLVDSQLEEDTLYIVLELGEIDLANLLMKQKKQGGFNENYIRLYWEQMLRAVHTIHEEMIVHGDLKPPNFLLVKGTMKLIDFGIAQAIQGDTTNISRDSQIGTLNYISPEALTETSDSDSCDRGVFKLGRASDIWSLGIILYHMAFNTTPFASIRNTMQKMRAICNPNFPIQFPDSHSVDPSLVDAIKCCLHRNPRDRATIPQLLKHPFLRPTGVAVSSAESSSSLSRSLAPSAAEGATATMTAHALDLATYVKTLASEGGVEPAVILEQLLSQMGGPTNSSSSSSTSSRGSSSRSSTGSTSSGGSVDGLTETVRVAPSSTGATSTSPARPRHGKGSELHMQLLQRRRELSHVDTVELERARSGKSSNSAVSALAQWMATKLKAEEDEVSPKKGEEDTDTWR